MNKNTATIIISLLGICAISSVALLVYVMISAPPSFPATSSFIQSTPIALVDQSQSVPQPTFTATPTLVTRLLPLPPSRRRICSRQRACFSALPS